MKKIIVFLYILCMTAALMIPASAAEIGRAHV